MQYILFWAYLELQLIFTLIVLFGDGWMKYDMLDAEDDKTWWKYTKRIFMLFIAIFPIILTYLEINKYIRLLVKKG